MTDEFDDEHGEEDEAEHVAPAVVDPGGVPKMLPAGYRSISPAVGIASAGALALIVGSAMWMVLFHPHATSAATTTTTVAHKQNGGDDNGDADAKTLVPDPSLTQLGHLRTHPVF